MRAYTKKSITISLLLVLFFLFTIFILFRNFINNKTFLFLFIVLSLGTFFLFLIFFKKRYYKFLLEKIINDCQEKCIFNKHDKLWEFQDRNKKLRSFPERKQCLESCILDSINSLEEKELIRKLYFLSKNPNKKRKFKVFLFFLLFVIVFIIGFFIGINVNDTNNIAPSQETEVNSFQEKEPISYCAKKCSSFYPEAPKEDILLLSCFKACLMQQGVDPSKLF